MKTLFRFTLMAFLGLSFAVNLTAQCTSTTAFGNIAAPTIMGVPVNATTCAFGGEFSTFTGTTAGNSYTFSATGGTGNFLTIRQTNGTGTLITSGLSPVTVASSPGGTIAVIVHTNAGCGTDGVCHTVTAVCNNCPPPTADCINSSAFGSATINTSGTAVTISTCSFGGEYSTISGAVSGQTLRFTYSLTGGFITVRSGTPGGPVVASGNSPLTFANSFTGTLYAHWNTSSACGSNTSCSATTVQCTSCSVPAGPANDACANATPIACGGTATGSTATATIDGPASDCNGGSVAPDVWYTITGTGNNITASLCGSGYDTQIDVYTGACGALTNIGGCNDDFCSVQSQMTWASTLGVVYRIRVHGFGGATGAFTLAVTCAAPPVPPCNAPGTPSASSISTTSATLSWGAAMGATSYRYSSGTGGHVCGTGSTTTNGTSASLNNLSPNTTYTFCVRTDACGGGSASSYVSTTFTTAPLANDACAGAQVVTCGSTINGSTVGAASDAAVGSCGVGTGGTPGNGVWYKLVGNGAQATVSLCGSSYDTKLHVYSGSCAGLTCLTSNDDFCGSQSQVVFNANLGTDYFILVSGFSSATGAFSMNISCLCGPVLGAPWTTTSIGAANGGAIENVCDNTIDISSNGYSSSSSSDAMFFAHQNLCGNQTITVKIDNITNGGFAGIMFRENTAAGSKMVAIKTQLNNFIHREMRSVTNGAKAVQQVTAFGHSWLRLVRNGNTFTGFRSSNGIAWQSAFTVTVAMNSCMQVGLFTQGLNQSSTSQASFSNVSGFPTGMGTLPSFEGDNNAVDMTHLDFALFPNPAQSEINVQLGNDFIGKEVTIRISNHLGQTVITHRIAEVQSQTERLQLNNLTGGLYILSLQTEGQELMSKKFVVGDNRP